MYLFKEDQAHLKPENYHLTTRNKSFVKMSRILHRMGIDNNKFFLVLTQPELAKYDPHNLKDSSKELRLKIAYEAKVNPWYGLRELIRIPETGGKTPFLLSRANLSIAWIYFNNIDCIVVMPRQHGKTIGTISLTTLLMYIISCNFNFTMVAQGNNLRKENVTRLKSMRDALPEWLLHLQPMKDINNMESVTYSALNNSYKTFVGNQSPAMADKASRGITTPSIHWDEFAHLINNHVMYPIAIGTTRAAINAAKKNKELYGNIITTTVGDLSTDEGKFCHDMITSSLPFNESLYDLKCNDLLRRIVAANSEQVMLYAEFSHLQLGTSDEEIQAIIAKSKGTKDVTDMEYLNIWRTSGTDTVLSKEDCDRLRTGIRPVTYSQYVDEFIINWYIPKDMVTSGDANKIPIVVGTDSSENIGKDFTTLVFTDVRSMTVVATCRCNTVNIVKVGVFIGKLIKEMNILWIPERNSTGSAIIDVVLLELEKFGINPFEVIYNEIVQDRDKYERVDIKNAALASKYRGYFGRRTTAGKTGRDWLYKDVFFKGIEEASTYLNDTTLINEMIGLRKKDGRVDHGSGAHDDMVIAWILCCFIVYFGKHVHHYRILSKDPSILLSRLKKAKSIKEERNQEITAEIKRLTVERTRTRSEGVKRSLDIKINRLTERLPMADKDKLPEVTAMAEVEAKQNGIKRRVNVHTIGNYFG